MKIFVRADGFQINQLHTIVECVTQQIELPLAVKFVDKQSASVSCTALCKSSCAWEQLFLSGSGVVGPQDYSNAPICQGDRTSRD